MPVAYTYHTRYEDYLHYFKVFQKMQDHDRLFHGVTKYSREVPVSYTHLDVYKRQTGAFLRG